MALEFEGELIAMADCDWVLFKGCGCPIGVCTGRHHEAESEAWAAFYDTGAEIAAAQSAGARIDLVKHEVWCAELLSRHMAGCTHGGKS